MQDFYSERRGDSQMLFQNSMDGEVVSVYDSGAQNHRGSKLQKVTKDLHDIQEHLTT